MTLLPAFFSWSLLGNMMFKRNNRWLCNQLGIFCVSQLLSLVRCKSPLTQNVPGFSSLMTSTNSCFFTTKISNVINFSKCSMHFLLSQWISESAFLQYGIGTPCLWWYLGFLRKAYFLNSTAVPYSVDFLPIYVSNFLIAS